MDNYEKALAVLVDGLKTGEVGIHEVLNQHNLPAQDRLNLVLASGLLSQGTVRTYCSTVAKTLLANYKPKYGLISPYVLEIVKLIESYEDDEDLCWPILEKQQGIDVVHKVFDPDIVGAIAGIISNTYLGYVQVEFMYEKTLYSNDEQADTSPEDPFVDGAIDMLLQILTNSIREQAN